MLSVPPMLQMPPPVRARFPEITQSVMLKSPTELRMPPPAAAEPWAIVRPEMRTCAGFEIESTRSCASAFPHNVSDADPGPRMSMSVLIAGSCASSAMRPTASNTIWSGPSGRFAVAFACWIAARSVHSL
jgi:hypothetical protein